MIVNTYMKHMPRDDCIQEDNKINISELNGKLENKLDNKNFVIDGDDGFDSLSFSLIPVTVTR